MTKLSVNVNKIALLRNSRGSNLPDLVKVALDCEKFGAQGITVHPRPDERHIKYADVSTLKEAISTEFNIEGYPNEKFVKLVYDNKPAQVTLVPDPPGVLTSDEGWDTRTHKDFLKGIISDFRKRNIRVSLFLNPSLEMMEGAKEVETDRIEFYTGAYANNYSLDKELAINPFVVAAKLANKMNIGINAGHDLNLENLNFFYKNIPNLLEVSIGHAIVCDSIYYGLKNTIHMYRNLLKN